MAAKKQPLSKLQRLGTPIKASDWFEQFDKLPNEELAKETPSKRRKKKEPEPENTMPSVKADDWFKNFELLPKEELAAAIENAAKQLKKKTTEADTEAAHVTVQSPENIDVKVDVEVKAIPQSLDIASKQKAVDSVRLEQQANDEMDGLVTSILSLTQAIQQDRIDRIRGEELPKEEKKTATSFSELIKTITKDKYSQLKEKTTLRNILFVSGVRSAFKGSESILDNLLAYREAKQAEAKKEAANKSQHSLLKSAVAGSADYTKTKLSNLLSSTFGRAGTAIGKAASPITQSAPVQSVMSIINSVREKTTIPKDFIATTKHNLSKSARIEAIKNPNSIVGSIARRYYPEIGNDNELEASRILNNPATPKEREFQKNVKSGMKDELLQLSEEQLKQLKKIAAAVTETQEDRLEKKDEKPSPIVEQKEKKKEEKTGSLIDTLMEKISGLKGVLGGAGKMLGSAAARLAPFAAPAAGVAAAGAGGYMLGGAINDNVINPAVEAITGVKGATLGTATYDTVDMMAGWFGKSDADKMKKAEAQAKRVVSGKVVNEKPTIDAKPSVKPAAAYRVGQMNQVKSTIKELDGAKAEAKKPAATSVVDARTNVVNNSTSVQYVRPHVRNNESTFNNLLNRNFNH